MNVPRGPMREVVRCRFCRNRAAWLYPNGWRICSSCRVVANEEGWRELARRWLRAYPEEWVPDVAAFVETHLALEGDLAEPFSGREDEM